MITWTEHPGLDTWAAYCGPLYMKLVREEPGRWSVNVDGTWGREKFSMECAITEALRMAAIWLDWSQGQINHGWEQLRADPHSALFVPPED